MQKLVLYIKTYKKDLSSVLKLLNSIEKHNRDKIPVYVSVNDCDYKFFEHELKSYKLNLHKDSDIIVCGIKDGWRYQQVVKSSFYRLNVCENYLSLDSDSEFIRDFFYSDFLYDNSTPYTIMHESKSLLETFNIIGHDSDTTFFKEGLPVLRKYFGTHGKYWDYGPSPYIWSTKVWKSFNEEFLAERNQTYEEFFLEIDKKITPSEASIYGEYLLKTRLIDIYPIEGLFKVYHYKEQYNLEKKYYDIDKLKKVYNGVIFQGNWTGKKPKRILFFMPDNPLHTDSGNKTRAKSFLTYFAEKGFAVDFFSEYQWAEWTDDEVKEFENSGLATNTYIFPRRPAKKDKIKYSLVKMRQVLINKLNGIDTRDMPNPATSYLRKQFDKVVETKEYDYVIINYAIWALLAQNKKIFKGAKLIIDTHDFITSQKLTNNVKQIGKSFSQELTRLQLFDEVWAISPDEHYLFSQFLGDKVRWVPMMSKSYTDTKPDVKKYDLVYVASNNRHNVTSIKWFMSEVYPLLSDDIRICMIGKIVDSVDDKPNITKLKFVEDLSEYYAQSKVAICPMLTGTGLKIKVVEAMSFGLPIVCNVRGLDGVPNKINNGCISTNDAQEFAKAIADILTSEDLYKQLSKDSANLFNQCFSLEVGYKRLDNIFNVDEEENFI